MDNLFDIVVVGGGPAGLTAALYALRNGKSTMIIEKEVFGGQIVNSPLVENIPGFVKIAGDEFGDLLLKQVMEQGGEVLFDCVSSIENNEECATVKLESGDNIKAKAVILATGTKHRTLGLEDEEKMIGDKIHFCAVCDGSRYKDKTVVMIGGGNSAFVEANHLADIVDKLIILQDLPYFTAEAKLQHDLLLKKNVETHLGCKILNYEINFGQLTGVKYEEDGKEKIVDCDGVFLAVGLIPDNLRFKNLVDLDDRGYFKADEYGLTKTDNIFVAGDARTKTLRQVATACSDGANAAIKACEYLRNN